MSHKINVLFIVVNAPLYYNVIIGHTTINPSKIILSKTHQKMKLTTAHGVGEILGD